MKVSWDYYYQYMGKSKMFQTTNQMISIKKHPAESSKLYVKETKAMVMGKSARKSQIR